ncbi:MAG: hypothetical protein KAV83_09405 [Desulfobacterales bacterium]|nr:hypothetical protein [Desulfobacterales bacterium]
MRTSKERVLLIIILFGFYFMFPAAVEGKDLILNQSGIAVRLQGLTFTTDVGLKNQLGHCLGRPPLTLVSLSFHSRNYKILLKDLLIDQAIDCKGKNIIPTQGGRMSIMHAERSADGRGILYSVIHLEPMTPGCDSIDLMTGQADFMLVLGEDSFSSKFFTPIEGNLISLQGIGKGWSVGKVEDQPQEVWTEKLKYETYNLVFELKADYLSLEEKKGIDHLEFLDEEGKKIPFLFGRKRWSHGKTNYVIKMKDMHDPIRLVIYKLEGKDVQVPFVFRDISVGKLGRKLVNFVERK